MATTPCEFRCTGLDTIINSPIINSPSFASSPDAHASVSVTLANMQTIFKIEFFDDTTKKTRFYVDRTAFYAHIDLSNAVMDVSASTQDIIMTSGGNNQYPDDYLRFISYKVFGNSNGVGLFTNATTVIQSIKSDFYSSYDSILAALDTNVGTGHAAGTSTVRGLTITRELDAGTTLLYVDASGNNQNDLNIGWNMFEGLIANNLTRATNFLNQTPAKYPFPFIVGDAISAYVTINANPSQKSLTLLSSSAIENRTYRIRIIVT